MLEGNNELEIGILTCLLKSPNMRLQWRDLKEKLKDYVGKKYSPGSLEVTLQRKLSHLCNEGSLKKANEGHQQVYYYIPQKKREEVEKELLKIAQMKGEKALLDSLSIPQLRQLKTAYNGLVNNFLIDCLVVRKVKGELVMTVFGDSHKIKRGSEPEERLGHRVPLILDRKIGQLPTYEEAFQIIEDYYRSNP